MLIKSSAGKGVLARRMLLPLCLFCSLALGQDHLVPESSDFFSPDSDIHEYHQLLADVFGKELFFNVEAGVLVGSSTTTNEYAIGIKHDAGAYRIFKLTPEIGYWTYLVLRDGSSHALKIPEHYQDIALTRCEREIEPALAESIIALWTDMLLGTRYARPDPADNSVVADGVAYHFSAHGYYGVAANPDPATSPGKLVAIAEAVGVWCDAPSDANKSALTTAVSALQEAMPNLQP